MNNSLKRGTSISPSFSKSKIIGYSETFSLLLSLTLLRRGWLRAESMVILLLGLKTIVF
jgi:hypothetical protein